MISLEIFTFYNTVFHHASFTRHRNTPPRVLVNPIIPFISK